MAFPLVCCSGGVSFVWHPLSTLLIMSRPDEEALGGNIRSDDQNRTMVCLFNSYHLGHTRPGNIIFSVSLFGKYHDIVSQTLGISDQTTRTEMLCLFNSYHLGHTRPGNIIIYVTFSVSLFGKYHDIALLKVKHCEHQIRRPEQRCCVSSTLIVSGTQGLRILYFMFSQYFKPNIGNIWSDDQNNVVYLQLLSPRTQISHKLSFSISGGSLFLSVMMPGPLG